MENYQLKLEKVINSLESVPTLLLHSCCAPCSSYVLEYLSEFFKITVFYYNPNITEQAEYRKRVAEQKRLISQMPLKNRVEFLEGDYNPNEFFCLAKGLENLPEGGKRCENCFNLRLEKTAETAKKRGFDYFCTTLTVSPHKNAELINKIGKFMEEKYSVKYLESDFKKKNGYIRSINLSKEYSLYRQNYCGCIYSKNR